jgi:hypothetical protein
MNKLQCYACKAVFDSDDAVTVTEWEPTPSPGYPHGSRVTILHCPECNSDELEDHMGEKE